MRNRKVAVTVPVKVYGVEIDAKYDYFPGYRGAREGGYQLEPDEQPNVEILDVYIGKVSIYNLLEDDVLDEISTRVFQYINENPDERD